MSEIRFFALGGLAENGKNMFVIDVDGDLFVLDAGIKFPTSEFYGVDEIIPDYKSLIRVKSRIKGFFMTHAHEDHIADRKSTRLNSSHVRISYAVFCLKK